MGCGASAQDTSQGGEASSRSVEQQKTTVPSLAMPSESERISFLELLQPKSGLSFHIEIPLHKKDEEISSQFFFATSDIPKTIMQKENKDGDTITYTSQSGVTAESKNGDKNVNVNSREGVTATDAEGGKSVNVNAKEQTATATDEGGKSISVTKGESVEAEDTAGGKAVGVSKEDGLSLENEEEGKSVEIGQKPGARVKGKIQEGQEDQQEEMDGKKHNRDTCCVAGCTSDEAAEFSGEQRFQLVDCGQGFFRLVLGSDTGRCLQLAAPGIKSQLADEPRLLQTGYTPSGKEDHLDDGIVHKVADEAIDLKNKKSEKMEEKNQQVQEGETSEEEKNVVAKKIDDDQTLFFIFNATKNVNDLKFSLGLRTAPTTAVRCVSNVMPRRLELPAEGYALNAEQECVTEFLWKVCDENN